jgi:hypothetical protein
MLLLRSRTPASAPRRRGAALMLSMLVLIVLVALVFQINIATGTDARIARNDVALTAMDLAAESALLLKFDQLVADGLAAQDAAAAGGAEGTTGGLPGGAGGAGLGGLLGGAAGGAGGEEGGGSEAVDSREDEWAKVESTTINELQVRILVQDENSKYNVLSMLTEDPGEAEKAFRRVARILDLFREGTEEDLDGGEAERLAELIRDHLRQATDATRALLATDDPQEREEWKPLLTLREMVQYPEFGERLFRDFRTEDGTVVHGITSYLTVWSALQTKAQLDEARAAVPEGALTGGGGQQGGDQGGGGQGGGGQGGQVTGGAGSGATQFSGGQGAQGDASEATGIDGQEQGEGGSTGLVNINTAPPVVLKALLPDNEVDPRFWDEVVVFRNEEDEEQIDPDAEPVYDEYGEEIVPRQVFGSVSELSSIDGFENIEPIHQAEIGNLVGTTSDVFTIYVTVRRPTQAGGGLSQQALSREEFDEQLHAPTNLSRTVACTVWRRANGEDIELVPLQRWEYLEYVPYEVLDYPGEDR